MAARDVSVVVPPATLVVLSAILAEMKIESKVSDL
jgi:hypothetical protein